MTTRKTAFSETVPLAFRCSSSAKKRRASGKKTESSVKERRKEPETEEKPEHTDKKGKLKRD